MKEKAFDFCQSEDNRVKKSNLVLIGGGGHARDIYGLIDDINKKSSLQIEVDAILDDTWQNTSRFVGCDVPLVKGIEKNLKKGDRFVTCIGYPENRKKLSALAISKGLSFQSPLIHPLANIGREIDFGFGSVVFGLCNLSSNVKIGENSCISYGVSVGHDTVIGDNVSVMPGAVIGGDVTIGSDVLVGSGAIILEKIVVGSGATVGAGSLVTKNIESCAVVIGVPAKRR